MSSGNHKLQRPSRDVCQDLVVGPELSDREGGIKIVFDVPDHLRDVASAVVAASGFVVRSYYSWPPSQGGLPPGHARLGAERKRDLFTEQERDAVVAAFEAVVRENKIEIEVVIVGVDTWEAW